MQNKNKQKKQDSDEMPVSYDTQGTLKEAHILSFISLIGR